MIVVLTLQLKPNLSTVVLISNNNNKVKDDPMKN